MRAVGAIGDLAGCFQDQLKQNNYSGDQRRIITMTSQFLPEDGEFYGPEREALL